MNLFKEILFQFGINVKKKFFISYNFFAMKIRTEKFPRLKDLREDNDLKQRQLAEILHIGQPTYNHYEKGCREIPIDCLIELAKFYRTSIDYIVGLTDEFEPYPKRRRRNFDP